MFNRKVCIILLTSLVLSSLFACGSGGNTANLNVSTENSSGVQLEAISVTPTNPSIAVDTDIQFTATGIYSDNTTQDLTSTVTWSSSAVDAMDVASGDEVAQFTGFSYSTGDYSHSHYRPGHTKATGCGKARITAKWGNVSGSTTITVTSATVVSIAITPTTPNIVNGTSKQFVAMGTFSDNTTQDLTSTVTWNSSSLSVATISNEEGSNGLATSITSGSTTISATSGDISGSTSLTVTAATLVSIEVTPVNPSITLGTTEQFTATGTYDDGSTQDLTTSVIWKSSSSSVASISNAAGSNGLATSVAAGSTTITATSGGVSGSATLTVTSATLTAISITPTNPSIALGTTKQFTATGSYSDGSTQNLTASATWKSSSSSVASISNAAGSNGLATSVAAGSTTITATSGGVSGSATLTVTGGGTITLAWDAPTTNTDGSYLDPATDIVSYKIYYGTSSLTYASVVTVSNPGTTTVSKTLNLSAGTYYFTVTAIDSAGLESSYSNEAMTTI
jgi:hypothetical protein